MSTWRFFTYYTSLVIGGVMFYKAIGTENRFLATDSRTALKLKANMEFRIEEMA